jgi:hypothetical protein
MFEEGSTFVPVGVYGDGVASESVYLVCQRGFMTSNCLEIGAKHF